MRPEHLRASLLDWCLDGLGFSARVVGGGAGSGKTRLAVQLCEDLAPFGWVRGLLTPARHQAESEALVATPTPRRPHLSSPRAGPSRSEHP